MKQPKVLTSMFVALAIASLIPLSLQANPMEFPEAPGHCSMGEKHMPLYLRGIDLSDAQEDNIFSILHNVEPQMRQKMKVLHQAHQGMMALASSPQYDEAEARHLADATAKIMAEMDVLRARTDHQLLFVLDENQRQQVAFNKDKFAAEHRPPF